MIFRFRIGFVFLFLAVLAFWGYSKEPTIFTADSKVAVTLPDLGMLTADFAEPFLPLTKDADSQAISEALERYNTDVRPKYQKVDVLEAYLVDHPNDPWAPSVKLNLGLYYHKSGRFTPALEYLKTAWEQLDAAKNPRLKPLADHALGEYAITLAHLGRIEELEPLLAKVQDRSLQGLSTEFLTAAREGLLAMKVTPEISFLCGPAALRRVGEFTGVLDDKGREVVKTLPSTRRGTSLAQVYQLSEKLDLDYQMAFRKPGSQLVTPSVVHWRVGHFAALLDPEDGLYPVEDDTAGFGRDAIRMAASAVDSESSGYFLIPSGPLPSGWRAVDFEEGRTVWGRGYTGFSKNSGGTGGGDAAAGGSGSGGSGPSGGGGGPSGDGPSGPGGGGGGPGSECDGMTVWDIHLMLVSLRLIDTPVGLSPAAFAVPFQVTYAQREVGQPAVFDYANLGPKWTSNWTSYLTDTRSSNRTIVRYQPNGGSEEFTFARDTSVSNQGPYSQAFLTDLGDGFRLDWGNGSKAEYRKQIGSRYHLTSMSDAQGNTTSLEYDGLNRLSVIRDAVGRPMTVEYDLATDPLKITSVTDPFGRSASFSYTTDGHLESVTDVLGLVSSYEYGDNDFIHTLNTPYGTTTFTYGDVGTDPSLGIVRFLEVVDAEGRTHRVESSNNGVAREAQVPTGMPTSNIYLQYRNTFYWEPQQLDSTPDYSKATVYHFLHTQDARATGRVLESVKRPLENRVWYAYPNHRDRVFSGNNKPTHIGRVFGDGTTQLTKYQYNSRGNVTQMTDPAGRVFTYTYAPNDIDLTSISTSGQTLFSATYDSNHNILTITDSSGSSSAFSYNARGLVETILNPLGELTTYNYTGTGNLVSIEMPLQKTTSFSYDSAERVLSATDSEGYTVQASYDVFDRLTTVTYPDGTKDELTYNRLDLINTKDRIGRQTQMSHDSLRRLTSITDANGGSTSLGYGIEDGPITLTDPNGNTTGFQYDLQQRLIKKTYPGGANQFITYQNCCARVASVTDALGQSKTYSYFLDNQLKSIEYSGDTPTVTFTNDSFLPRPLSMTDGDGITTYSYVPIGSPGANRISSVTQPFGDIYSFVYDNAGRVIGGTVNGVAESVSYDELWRPTSITNALDTFNMAYLGKTGQVTVLSSGEGPKTEFNYTSNTEDRRLSQIKNLRKIGTPLSQFDYEYDSVGQILKLTQSFGTDASEGGN